MEKTKKTVEAEKIEKKEYHFPVIQKIGDIRISTQGGWGDSNDTNGPGGPTSQP